MTTGNATPLNMLAAIANINYNQREMHRVRCAMAHAAAAAAARGGPILPGPMPGFSRMMLTPSMMGSAPAPGFITGKNTNKRCAPTDLVSSMAATRPASKRPKMTPLPSLKDVTAKKLILTKTTSTPATPLPLKSIKPSPAQYLRKLFEDHKLNASNIPEKPVRDSFVKPDKKETDSYDAAARLVRINDLGELQALHKEGKNLDACNKTGESLLMIACRRGHVDVAKFLLNDAHVRWDLRDDFGRTAVHDACWLPVPNIELMEVLFQVVSPEWLLAPDVRGHTPFDYARREHADIWYDYLKEREGKLKQKIASTKKVEDRQNSSTV